MSMWSSGKVLPIGACVLVGLMLFAGVDWRFSSAANARAERDLAISQIDRLIKNANALSAELDASKFTQSNALNLWQSQTEAGPANEVQSLLDQMVHENGATLLSIAGVHTHRISNIQSLRLSLEGEADLVQWQSLMISLSDHQPFFLISALELRRLNRLSQTGQPIVLFRMTIDSPFITTEPI